MEVQKPELLDPYICETAYPVLIISHLGQLIFFQHFIGLYLVIQVGTQHIPITLNRLSSPHLIVCSMMNVLYHGCLQTMKIAGSSG